MVEYFKDGAIRPELVTEDAKKAAGGFFLDRRNALRANQLRKFYGDVKTLELRIKSAPEDRKEAAFQQILPLVKLLKAKTAYAAKRKVIPESFKSWIWENVDAVNSLKEFSAFLLYFEAVVGFCYGLAEGDFN